MRPSAHLKLERDLFADVDEQASASGGAPIYRGEEPKQIRPSQKGFLRLFGRIRYQLGGGLLLSVILPAVLRNRFELKLAANSGENTLIGTGIAMLVGAYLYRRLLAYPGVQGLAFVLPALVASYGGMLLIFFFLRFEYSRTQFLASFVLALGWFIFVSLVEKRYKRPRLGLVPGGNTPSLRRLREADWFILGIPDRVPRGCSGIVADLRADLDDRWEQFIAKCALKGLPVFHSKTISESLTGRVEIEHLSENSLGSLIPNSVYMRVKGLLDWLGVICALPTVIPIAALAAVMIKLEDGGPVFFTQKRMGFRGEVFRILKFRTMQVDAEESGQYTEGNDRRVTRVGRFLRRYRIDELPQVINILKGEMSWIGPRPESLPLSEYYESQIPFYSYRHIVRPGITGWAQVQQGYAAEVQAVTGKLHYDFYYIKNFSPWLDLLIAARTIRTVLTGFGAR